MKVSIVPITGDVVECIGGIDGLVARRLDVFVDDRGRLVPLFAETVETRNDLDEKGTSEPREFSLDVGRVRYGYASYTIRGSVRAWHRHEHQTDRFVVLTGTVVFAFVDPFMIDGGRREVVEVPISSGRPTIVLVPPGVWHGFFAVDDVLLLNLPSREYVVGDPDEERCPADVVPGCEEYGDVYDWRRRRDR